MHNEAENHYTLNDLIDILGVSRRTLLKYIKQGKLRAFKIGNQWRVTEEELNNFREKNSNY